MNDGPEGARSHPQGSPFPRPCLSGQHASGRAQPVLGHVPDTWSRGDPRCRAAMLRQGSGAALGSGQRHPPRPARSHGPARAARSIARWRHRLLWAPARQLPPALPCPALLFPAAPSSATLSPSLPCPPLLSPTLLGAAQGGCEARPPPGRSPAQGNAAGLGARALMTRTAEGSVSPRFRPPSHPRLGLEEKSHSPAPGTE